MGALCCPMCFNKSLHGMEIADMVSVNLTTMIRDIKWGNDLYDTLTVKLNEETKRMIEIKIVEHVKKNNIKVLNPNGYITEYIALNIAGLIFHKFIWDILAQNETITLEYPDYKEIEMDYKDMFTDIAIHIHTNKFKEKNYFNVFVKEFIKKRNLQEYNIKYQLGKEVITKHLENYLTLVINQIINNNNMDGLNYSTYMNTMITKKNVYESLIENSFTKVVP